MKNDTNEFFHILGNNLQLMDHNLKKIKNSYKIKCEEEFLDEFEKLDSSLKEIIKSYNEFRERILKSDFKQE